MVAIPWVFHLFKAATRAALNTLLSDVGGRRLCRMSYLYQVRVPLRNVPETPSGEDEEQQRTDAKGDDIDPIPVPVGNRRSPSTDDQLRGDEENKHSRGCIAEPMGECRDQHTTSRVIEDPGEEERCSNRGEEEPCVIGEAERSEQPRKERGQMPQAMQRAQNDAPHDGAVALLQPRQRKAAPAQFFSE